MHLSEEILLDAITFLDRPLVLKYRLGLRGKGRGKGKRAKLNNRDNLRERMHDDLKSTERAGDRP